MLSESDTKWCHNLLKTLQNSRNKDKCVFFLVPVASVLEPADLAVYETVVSNPKDLRTMEDDLIANKYSSVEGFIADALLCFQNAILFNKSRHAHVAAAAESLKKVVKAEEAKYLKAREAAAAKASATAAASSAKAAAVKKAEPVMFIPQCIQTLGMLAGMDDTALFKEPVDRTAFADYPLRVDNPMDFGTIRGMLSDGKIKAPSEFALLVRRVFANCFIYNYQLRGDLAPVVKAIRQRAKEMLYAFEDSWRVKFPDVAPAFPQVKECMDVIDELLKLPSVGINLHAIDNFMDPLPKYFNGEYPAGYLDVIDIPMALATVTQNVVEARYRTPAEFKRDVLLIFSNCEQWSHSEQGYYDTEMEQDAKTLRKKFITAYDSHLGSAVTAGSKRKAAADEPSAAPLIPKKKADKAEPAAPAPVSKPAPTPAPAAPSVKLTKVVLKDKYTFCVDEVKDHFIEAPLGKVYTADYFIKAVDPTKYEGYAELVVHPMCLAMVEKKIRSDRYRSMGDIMKDIYLVRHNTYVYNTGGAGLEIRILADHFVNNFSFLLTLVAKQIIHMQDMVSATTQATVKASIETAVGAISEDLKLLIQVYHGAEGSNKTKASSEIYASISDDFFKQPYLDGISKEYERPEPPSAAILDGLHSFYKYDPRTFALDRHQVVVAPPPPPPPAQATPTKAALKRDTSEAVSTVSFNDNASVDYDYTQPNRGGKSAGKSGKKRRREEEFEPYEPPPLLGAEENMEIIVSVARPPSEWEQSCLDILRKVLKHDFVDISRPAKAGNIVSNFVSPVIELYPQVAESYLALIETPMDLSIIGSRLEDHGFLDCEDFYEKMVLVFQNAIDYNRPHMEDGEYAQKLVPRCEHMIRYIKWLCLELLPTADDTDSSEPESLGFLRKSVVEAERQVRVTALRNQPIDSVKDCLAFIKKFDHKKTAKQYAYFAFPVSLKDVPNYSTFVRKPMDFGTVKEKLENGRYPSYMAFVEDIQLIFSNAKRFNGAFKDSDAFSQTIWDAASMFEERLESVLYKEFSIEVLERLYWNGIRFAEDEKLRLEYQKKMEKQRSEDLEFRDRETARVKSIDTAFAIDQDRELKRSHALDGLLHSDSARKSIGLFSDSALYVPSVEEREAGLLEVARRRDHLFEAAWERWSTRSAGVSSRDVTASRSTSFDNLRSPPKLRGSASFGRLSAADTDDDGNILRIASGELVTPSAGQLSRPREGPLLLQLQRKTKRDPVTTSGRAESKAPARAKNVPQCFGETDVEEIGPEDTTLMQLCSNNAPTASVAEAPIAMEVVEPPAAGESSAEEARRVGVRLHRRHVPQALAASSVDSSSDGFLCVVEYLLSSGAALCRVLSPRAWDTRAGPIQLSGRRFTLAGSSAQHSVRQGKAPPNSDMQLSPQLNARLCDAIRDILSSGEDLRPCAGGEEHYMQAVDLGECQSSSERLLLRPFIQRAEGGRRPAQAPESGLVDELLFRMSVVGGCDAPPARQFPAAVPCHPDALDSAERPSVELFDNLEGVSFRHWGSPNCLLSSGFECVDAALVLNKAGDNVSHCYTQYWLLIGEPTELCVELAGQEHVFQVCSKG